MAVNRRLRSRNARHAWCRRCSASSRLPCGPQATGITACTASTAPSRSLLRCRRWPSCTPSRPGRRRDTPPPRGRSGISPSRPSTRPCPAISIRRERSSTPTRRLRWPVLPRPRRFRSRASAPAWAAPSAGSPATKTPTALVEQGARQDQGEEEWLRTPKKGKGLKGNHTYILIGAGLAAAYVLYRYEKNKSSSSSTTAASTRPPARATTARHPMPPRELSADGTTCGAAGSISSGNGNTTGAGGLPQIRSCILLRGHLVLSLVPVAAASRARRMAMATV